MFKLREHIKENLDDFIKSSDKTLRLVWDVHGMGVFKLETQRSAKWVERENKILEMIEIINSRPGKKHDKAFIDEINSKQSTIQHLKNINILKRKDVDWEYLKKSYKSEVKLKPELVDLFPLSEKARKTRAAAFVTKTSTPVYVDKELFPSIRSAIRHFSNKQGEVIQAAIRGKKPHPNIWIASPGATTNDFCRNRPI